MSNDYKLQLNVKLGQGYDAHLLNITGQDPTEFQNTLQWVTQNAAGIVSTAVALEAAYAVKPLAGNIQSVAVVNEQPQATGAWATRDYATPEQRQQQAQPQQQYQQPMQQSGPPAPSCRHGAMKMVPAGVSKSSGKPYPGFWACTAPRDQQCQSVNP